MKIIANCQFVQVIFKLPGFEAKALAKKLTLQVKLKDIKAFPIIYKVAISTE